MTRVPQTIFVTILILTVFSTGEAQDIESMPVETFVKEAANVTTHERAFELANAVCNSGRVDLAVKCLDAPRLWAGFMTALKKVGPSAKKDEILMALMQHKWPNDDAADPLSPRSSGPPELELIAIRVLSSRLPNENLKEDEQSIQRLSSRSERLKLVEKFRDALQNGKEGSSQPRSAPEFSKAPREAPPIIPRPLVTPAVSSPVAPAAVPNPAPVVEHPSPALPWVVGIVALTTIALFVIKHRARGL
jgi:hypothetical protein